ncbi:MAG: Ig-like domain-containing protein, partial [Halanaerobiales bacterium]
TISIDKGGIALRANAEEGESVVLDSVEIAGKSGEISGFDIKDSDGKGVDIGAKKVKVHKNSISGHEIDGIRIEEGSAEISENEITDCYRGISVIKDIGDEGVKILDNPSIKNCDEGIYLREVSKVDIKNNKIMNVLAWREEEGRENYDDITVENNNFEIPLNDGDDYNYMYVRYEIDEYPENSEIAPVLEEFIDNNDFNGYNLSVEDNIEGANHSLIGLDDLPIESFEEISISVDYGTSEDGVKDKLPAQVTANLVDDSETELEVSGWSSEDYNGEEAGDYTFAGTVNYAGESKEVEAEVTVQEEESD